MKNLIILFCCLLSTISFAQTTLTFKLKDTQGKFLPNVEITAKSEKLVFKQTTNNTGQAIFTITDPGLYSISYLDVKDASSFEVKEGYKATFTRSLTYDPQGVFTVQPNFDRKNIQFNNLSANALMKKPNTAKVSVIVQEKNGTKVSSQIVELVSEKDKTKYKSTTNASGIAVFYVPINQEYEIDIDGIEGFQKFKVGNYQNMVFSEVVYFEKTKLRENKNGDTIVQQNITQTNGTSTHHLFTLFLKNYADQPSVGEKVYLKSTENNTVYQGVIDASGKCVFLLKKGSNYLVNLTYESGICLVNATETKGFSSSSETRRYRGTATINKMLAERRVNKDGFVINHDQTPIKKSTPEANYLKVNPKGYDVKFGDSGPIGTPTIADNKIFTQEGFHSPNFYCLDALTGKNIWGVELGESGISPIVYHNGILLINTYSCTLYAIDAKNGTMLWSKWLAGTIYSTPSADGTSVYVVYNNGYDNPRNPSENFVLASFDLKTGKENWMAWIDKEVIACPVVEGNEVHLASQSGQYYVFDKTNGKKILSTQTWKAVTSPTLTPDFIYITANVNGKEQLMVLDRKTLKTVKKYPQIFQTDFSSSKRDCYEQMNYNGAHPLIYKNELIILLDKSRLMVFDAKSESLLWEQKVEANSNQTPIISNGKVMIAAKDGGIWTYDLKTGANILNEKIESEIDGQPVGFKDFIIIGAAGVLKMIKSNHRIPWTQWNKDASHNTVLE